MAVLEGAAVNFKRGIGFVEFHPFQIFAVFKHTATKSSMTAPTHIDAGYSAVDEHRVFGLKARFMHIAVRNQIAATTEDRSVKSVDFFGKERSYGVKTNAVLKHGSVQCEGDIGRKQNRLQFFAIGEDSVLVITVLAVAQVYGGDAGVVKVVVVISSSLGVKCKFARQVGAISKGCAMQFGNCFGEERLNGFQCGTAFEGTAFKDLQLGWQDNAFKSGAVLANRTIQARYGVGEGDFGDGVEILEAAAIDLSDICRPDF